MKIYTRTGDEGETGLLGGSRVSKAAPRVAAYGDLDELNSVLGLAASYLPLPRPQGDASADQDSVDQESVSVELAREVFALQRTLFVVGAELATPPDSEAPARVVRSQAVEALERSIDHWTARSEPLQSFILPGGCPAGAALHVARAVCRRCEREVVTLMQHEKVRHDLLRYLNRLSDLLFVMARAANAAASRPEPIWSADEA